MKSQHQKQYLWTPTTTTISNRNIKNNQHFHLPAVNYWGQHIGRYASCVRNMRLPQTINIKLPFDSQSK